MSKMPSPKEVLVLRILSADHAYGLEIVHRSGGQLSKGGIYVTLDRMKEKGFVRSVRSRTPKSGGLPRRIYEPTALGRRVLYAVDLIDRVMT